MKTLQRFDRIRNILFATQNLDLKAQLEVLAQQLRASQPEVRFWWAQSEENAFELMQSVNIDMLISDYGRNASPDEEVKSLDGEALLNRARKADMHMTVLLVNASSSADLLVNLQNKSSQVVEDCCGHLIVEPISFEMLCESLHAADQRVHERDCFSA